MTSTPLLEAAGASGILLLAAGLAFWRLLQSDMSRRRSVLFWALLLLAASGPLAVRMLTAPSAFDQSWLARASGRYETMWQELDAASLAAAASLETSSLESADRLMLFRTLVALSRPSGPTYLLLDPGGRAVAWAGEGLLHDLEAVELPSTGSIFRSGFSAVTLASVRRVGGQAAAWRLVAGRSYSSQRLPFPSPSGGRRGDYVWAVVPEGSRLPATASAVPLEGRPTLSVLMAPDAPLGGTSRRTFLLQASWLALAVACFVAFRSRRTSTAALDLFGLLSPLAILGTVGLATAARLRPLEVALLAGSLVLAWLSRQLAGGRRVRSWLWLVAPLGVAAVLFLGLRLEKLFGPIDLGTALLPSAAAVGLRLTIFMVLLATFLPAMAGSTREARGTRRWLWLVALAFLALGAALADRPVAGSLCVLIAALLGARWLRDTPRPSPLSSALILVTASALTAGAAWEVGYRSLTARYLERDVAPLLGPPTVSEKEALRSEVTEFFRLFDLADIAAADPRTVDETDLAYALWTRSPLAIGAASLRWR